MTAPFFIKSQLQVVALYDDVVAEFPLALHPNGHICVYNLGRYRADSNRLDWLIADRLGDRFRPDHLRTFRSYATARLDHEGRLVRTVNDDGLVNLANGMLDPFTGQLHPNSNDHFSAVQLPVSYDPTATSPNFDRWFADVLPNDELRQALLEDIGRFLDTRPDQQKKAVHLVGPSRTGKSTLARVIEEIAGVGNRSAEELADLSSNRFRAAELDGKLINIASDIDVAKIANVATFKRLTGADTISAEKKFQDPFAFRYGGLFMFTSNDVPTVNDRAFFARVRPVRFTRSFLGDEDPTIERAIMSELPGVLNLLVAGLQRFERRGTYLETPATRDDATWYELNADPVALFLGEGTRTGGFTPRMALAGAYREWASDNRHAALTKRALYAAVTDRGTPVITRKGVRGFPVTLVDDYDAVPT